MKLVAAATLFAAVATSAAAFTLHNTNVPNKLATFSSRNTSYSPSKLFASVSSTNTKTEEESPCEVPEDSKPLIDLSQLKGSASLLRSVALTNVDGTYANDWCAVQQQLEDEGIKGPFFISIGDKDKLQTFLTQNPNIPKDQMFVDDYSFDAYKKVGFKSFLEVDKETVKDVKMTAPQLSFKQWMSYAGNVGKISPIPKDMKFGDVPEGVLRLGGTFVVSGDDVVYQWSDRIPGDHPDINEVVEIAKNAPLQTKVVEKVKSFLGLF